LKNKDIIKEINKIIFNEKGLVPCIVQSHEGNDVLMFAWMNKESLLMTLDTKLATFWSRSRNKLWVKGESSGNKQKVLEIKIDCDKDCVLLKVDQNGVACHTGSRSCFFSTLYPSVMKLD
jgi:phosphoribosyl-AMP cyclohydrolase